METHSAGCLTQFTQLNEQQLDHNSNTSVQDSFIVLLNTRRASTENDTLMHFPERCNITKLKHVCVCILVCHDYQSENCT